MTGLIYEEVVYTFLNLLLYTLMIKPITLPIKRTLLLVVVSILFPIILPLIIKNEVVLYTVITVIDLSIFLFWISYFDIKIKEGLMLLGATILIKIPLSIIPLVVVKILHLLIGIPDSNTLLMDYIFPLLLIFTLLLSSRWVPYKEVIKVIFRQKDTVKWLIVLLYIFAAILLLFASTNAFSVSISNSDRFRVEMAIAIMFLFFEYLILKSYFEDKRIKQKLVEQEKYLQGLEVAAETYQEIYLDNKKHLDQLSEEMFSNSKIYKQHFFIINELSKLKCPVISAFIFSQFLIAKKNNTSFHVYVEKDLDLYPFSEFEKVEMLGILINNALEAALKTKSPEIWLTFSNYIDKSSSTSRYEISVTNSSKYVSPTIIHNIFTRKSLLKSRGIGLSKLKSIISNKGEIYASYDIKLMRFNVTIYY